MKRLIEYGLVVLVAMIVAFLIIWLIFPKPGPCTNCTVSMPQVRAECDKRFFASPPWNAKTLDAGQEHEYLVAFVDTSVDPTAGGNGYTPPAGGYSGATPAAPAVRVPGYVMIRAQPSVGYNYSGSGYNTPYDLSNTKPEQPWEDVTLTIAKYVNPLRNDQVCRDTVVKFRESRFENYCEIDTKFAVDEAPQQTYRVFVKNESNSPIEYCIVTNCDASAPFGGGTMCQVEQPAQ